MINIPITKILFLDIETVGACPNYESCERFSPEIADQFSKYLDWFLKRFPEDTGLTKDEIFTKRAALVPEFAKIVCVSVAFVLENGETKKQSFVGDDEKKLLKEVRTLLDRCEKLGFYLPGFCVIRR